MADIVTGKDIGKYCRLDDKEFGGIIGRIEEIKNNNIKIKIFNSSSPLHNKITTIQDPKPITHIYNYIWDEDTEKDFYYGNFSVHCNTEDEAKDFLKFLQKKGYRWEKSTINLTENSYFNYCKEICYYVKTMEFLTFSSIYFMENKKIIPYSCIYFPNKSCKTFFDIGDVVKVKDTIYFLNGTIQRKGEEFVVHPNNRNYYNKYYELIYSSNDNETKWDKYNMKEQEEYEIVRPFNLLDIWNEFDHDCHEFQVEFGKLLNEYTYNDQKRLWEVGSKVRSFKKDNIPKTLWDNRKHLEEKDFIKKKEKEIVLEPGMKLVREIDNIKCMICQISIDRLRLFNLSDGRGFGSPFQEGTTLTEYNEIRSKKYKWKILEG